MISGGGSGGHVFPAIAIADALRAKEPAAEIRFVGALGKLEMEKVPQAGYPIDGLWISGLHRRRAWRNVTFPFKLATSLFKAWQLLRSYRPQVVVGVGGFASGPLLEVAARMGIPTLIQEQNSYPGLTNKLLARQADRICVAYDRMERYFPADKLVKTGNPVRQDLRKSLPDRTTAAAHFGLDPALPTVFIVGGSLGAESINEAVAHNTEQLAAQPQLQWLWQLGKLYEERFIDSATARLPQVKAQAFIDRMDMAYALADLMICRAGAMTIAELMQVGQAALLIPSPNVAEDHQSENARALVREEAAVLLPDAEARERIIQQAVELLAEPERLKRLRENIRKLARPDAADRIAAEVLKLIKN